ncbi:hypothetical protein KPP03845_101082 [Streptomyces xanthophaeus]|uniref:DUF1918 domain-containing protein n=1 Tax=Streptomyces xanthophaeus TaxID=67385 RepID=UPI00233F0EA2|nr:DUF1918 domain-containing protein [Streptomyces xanthophaeus]WCD84759.1 hypothetical protein KPP03845_101082 [Streptomyces xanthophaeus]
MNARSPADGHGIHAEPGDRIVVGGPTVGTPGRDGEVVALHHDDGTPPYDVRWSDTGRTTVFFPGPDAHVRHLHHASGTPRHDQGPNGAMAR